MKTIEVSIKEFAVIVLRKWPVVLACAAIFAMLFGLLGDRTYQQQLQKEQSKYERAVEEYERNAGQNAIKLSELKKEKDIIEAYLNDDILMNIDPNNKQIASIMIQMTVDPVGQIVDFNTSRQLLERYYALASDAPLQMLFSDFLLKEYDERYLHKIYNISRGTFDNFTITIIGNEDIDADKCVQAVYDYLLAYQETVTKGSNLRHSIPILSRSNTRVIDDELKSKQNEQKQKLEALETKIAAIETDTFNKPESSEVPVKSKHDFFSQTPYGALIGIVVGILVISLFYVLRLPIQLPEQLQRQLGIRYLGGIKRRKNARNLAEKLAGNLRMSEDEKAVDLILANFNEVRGEHRKILVTGTAPEGVIKDFIKSMEKMIKPDGVSLVFAADVNADAVAVSTLSNADAVLLVERLNHSRLRQVNHIKERIEMSGKEILGYVLV